MSAMKIQMQDHEGNKHYPVTLSSYVYDGEGKSMDDRLAALAVLLDWFEWGDDEHTSVKTKYNFWSEKQSAAGGIGEETGSGGGGIGTITGIVVNGKTYNEPDNMGLLTLPDYPTSLLWSDIEGRPTELSAFSNDVGYIKEVTTSMLVEATGASYNAGKVLLSTGGGLGWTAMGEPDWDASSGKNYIANRPFWATWKYNRSNISVSNSETALQSACTTGSYDILVATVKYAGYTQSIYGTLGQIDATLTFNLSGGGEITFRKSYSTLYVSSPSSGVIIESLKITVSANVARLPEMYIPTTIARTESIQTWADGRYLKLSGQGKITSPEINVLYLNSTSSYSTSAMVLQVNDTNKAYFGVNDTNGAFIYNYAANSYIGVKPDGTPHYNGAYTLLHSGNIGSYAFVPRTRIKSDADANTLLTNGVYLNETGNGSGNNNFPQAYSILLTAALSSSFAAQISIGNKSMWIRRKVDSWSDWVEVINSTNIGSYNAGSATKLETARTIWGQSFDGTGNVSGSIYGGSKAFSIYGYDDSGNTNIVDCSGNNKKLWVGYGSAPKSYDTNVAGYNIYLYYGTSRAAGISLRSSGQLDVHVPASFGSSAYVAGQLLFGTNSDTGGYFASGSDRTYWGAYTHSKTAYKASNAYFYPNGSVRFPNNVDIGVAFNGTPSSGKLKIGNAILSWDSANNALKIEGNVYSTGQMASGGIGEEGDNIATYDKWGGLKPAYSTTGKATLTTASASFTNNPTIAARTTTEGRYYAVEMDSVGRAFVNVPWTDTNYWTLDASVSRIYPKDAARQLCVGGTGNSAYSTSLYKLVVHGSAFAISGSWQSSSDMTMKDIVKETTLDIKDIAAAPSFVFKWKGSEDNTEWLGTSAQYWKAILPTAVKGEDGSYSLCYGELALTTAIAIAKKTMNHEERIKELELQVKTLKRKLSVYEN